MRVKKLELFGFKSFAEKTVIHFEPGVTAIVGPNGSGKSNVVDSIRWVLGEQNPRDVRAPRLEDVIFNGTDRRAPVSLAEVHLTISNEQGLLPIAFTEVTLTRRVFRSGESEYAINQSPCRLKDIRELFLGTGMGGGSYSIIEQGHIDLILSSKPEERRVPFEEASGVAKYLAKKHETMRRLDEVEEHLVRIADIVSEVRRQVSALERQANKARQYKSQWEEVKSLEMRLAVDELRQGEHRTQDMQQRLQELTAQRDALDTQKQAHLRSLESCNVDVSSRQQHLQDAQTRLVTSNAQIEHHESQSALKAHWIEELTAQVAQLEREAEHARAQLAHVAEQLTLVSGAESELQVQEDELRARLTQHREELSGLEVTLAQAQQALAEAKSRMFETASDVAVRRTAIGKLSAQAQSLEAQLTRLEAQSAQLATRSEELAVRQAAAHAEHAQVKTQHDAVHQRVGTGQFTLDATGIRRHELSGRLSHVREQTAHQRAQVTMLEDLWRRYEGFPDTVKTLMGCTIDGLVGPLVDLVQAQPGFESVIEAALGPLADALVVTDRAALMRCQGALREHQLKDARFLVLADCPASVPTAEMPVMSATVGSVRELIRTESAYQPLVDWLLNDSWLVDDLQQLVNETRLPYGRMVSRSGERWDRRSWRLLGSPHSEHGRVGRKPRWEQAQVALQAIEQELSQLEADSASVDQQWQSLLSQQESAKGELAHLSPSLQKLEGLIGQLAHEAQRASDDRRNVEMELQTLTAERAQVSASLAAAEQRVCEAEERQHTGERALAEAQTVSDAMSARKQQLVLTDTQLTGMEQSIAQRRDTIRVRRQELDAAHTHQQQQSDAKLAQRADAKRRSDALAQEREVHQRDTQQLRDACAQLHTDVEQCTALLQEEQAKRDLILPHLLEVEQQLSVVQQQMQEHTQHASEAAFRRSRIIERLRDLYQIDEATLQAEQATESEPLTDEQRSAWTEQVQKLRGKLEGMGAVSLGSVEEYDELKRRYEFLQSQQQDLLQARDDLKASIAQINRTARTQFRETFEKVRKEFQYYYARLFQGGEADLKLLDETDVLESGIDIVARPPGKRLQSISLLSGGERALTATALVFALFKVRPSPFCILDEIDAPLDEANVDRFTRVLEEFLALSQFILITHNKKTITKADSLYGVTMEEPGVSKILSAKLRTTPRASPTELPEIVHTPVEPQEASS